MNFLRRFIIQKLSYFTIDLNFFWQTGKNSLFSTLIKKVGK